MKAKQQLSMEKIQLKSHILQHSNIGEYQSIYYVPVLSEIVIFTFFRISQYYLQAEDSGMQKWSSIAQYSYTSFQNLEVPFSQSLNKILASATFVLNIFHEWSQIWLIATAWVTLHTSLLEVLVSTPLPTIPRQYLPLNILFLTSLMSGPRSGLLPVWIALNSVFLHPSLPHCIQGQCLPLHILFLTSLMSGPRSGSLLLYGLPCILPCKKSSC